MRKRRRFADFLIYHGVVGSAGGVDAICFGHLLRASEMEWLWGTFSISLRCCWINKEELHEVSSLWHFAMANGMAIISSSSNYAFFDINFSFSSFQVSIVARVAFTTHHHRFPSRQTINVCTTNLSVFEEHHSWGETSGFCKFYVLHQIQEYYFEEFKKLIFLFLLQF